MEGKWERKNERKIFKEILISDRRTNAKTKISEKVTGKSEKSFCTNKNYIS